MPVDREWLASRLSRAAGSAPAWQRAASLIYRASPGLTAAILALVAAGGALPGAIVALIRDLAPEAARAIGAGRAAELPFLLMPLGVVLVAVEAVSAARHFCLGLLAERVQEQMTAAIQSQAVTLDLAFHDLSSTREELYRVQAETAGRTLPLLRNVAGLAEAGITLLAVLAAGMRGGPWIAAVLVAGTAPVFLLQLKQKIDHYDWRRRSSALQREAWYYDYLIAGRDAAAEIRVLGLGDRFREGYRAVAAKLRAGRLRHLGREALIEAFGGGLTIAATAAACYWVLAGRGSTDTAIGGAAGLYQAMQYGFRAFRSALDGMGNLYVDGLLLGDYFRLTGMVPGIQAPPDPALPPERPVHGIRMTGVRFTYPGSEEEALRGLDLFVPAGAITVIVGVNGAGKSTLLKLLCRAYDCGAGSIEVDGTDIRRFDPAVWRSRIAWLPPQPLRHNASVLENIALGDATAPPDRDRAARAAEAAGAADIVAKLPDGMDTVLGAWFRPGAELSSGQWQRISAARAAYREAPVLLLDEPTSAMDPWQEAAWFERLRKDAAGRTVVVVTHRLTRARSAGLVYLIQEGRVVESGSHDELMARGGLYRSGWEADGLT